jgi:1-acyl-sn-glycerol-3-phosphate acyltransferase
LESYVNPMFQHETWLKTMIPVMQAARRYHNHEVKGLELVPEGTGATIVFNHSLATYDISLMLAALFIERGMAARTILDRLFFKVPLLGNFMENYLGAIQGRREIAEQLLRQKQIVAVAPGGMFEALRPSTQRYQIRWERRLGFVHVAMKTQTPVILAACPKADELYDVLPLNITSFFYEKYKLPVFLAAGRGLTPIPKPVKLTHYLSEPMVPPKWTRNEAERDRRAMAFHSQLVDKMNQLMCSGIRDPRRSGKDYSRRRGMPG